MNEKKRKKRVQWLKINDRPMLFESENGVKIQIVQVETHQITNMLGNLKERGMHFSLAKSCQTIYARNASRKQTCTTKPQNPHMHMQQHTISPFT